MRQPSRRITRSLTAILGGLCLAAALSTASLARVQDEAIAFFLYRGDSAAASNVALGGWGSGKAEEDSTTHLTGENSIKITTHGLYQGGRVDFKKPVDLSKALASKKCYLRLRTRFTGAGSRQDSFDPSSQITSQKADAPFQNMRFVLTMADGSIYELTRPLDVPPTDDPERYIPLHIPLAAVKKAAKGKALSGNGAMLKSLAICGDKYEQFNIGEIEVMTDDTQISVAELEDQIAFANNDMAFSADVEAGASTLKVTWDWDAKDGIQEDTFGRNVGHLFKRAGTYLITVTVTDVDGIKPPQQKTLKLEVSP
jgi:hypothetical protein